MNSVMGIGVTGIHTGMSMLERSGSQIAKANIAPESSESGDLSKPVVGLIEAKHQVEASAKVVEAGSETIGTLLDMRV